MFYLNKIRNLFSRHEPRIVALLAVRNEALYMERCLEHLFLQGIETCVIDNESTDDSRKIAEQFIGRGVIRIETQPYTGYSDLAARLRLKEKIAREIDADWFIHHDADEIREAPTPFKTLREGIVAADKEGYNAINFDEFVFVPTSDDESFEGTDYVDAMRYYYFFEPYPLRRVNAWKNIIKKIDLVSSGGHSVNFKGRRVCPKNFILRHYIVLSSIHAIAKYGSTIYSREAVEKRGWHGPRADFNPELLRFPVHFQLKYLGDNKAWDRSDVYLKHTFFGK